MTHSATAKQPPASELPKLPGQLTRLVRAIGLPATLRLLEARGGTVIKLPKRNAGVLLTWLEPAEIRKLVEEFGSRELELPRADKIVAHFRNVTIHTQHHVEGISLAKLALQYQLTLSQVKKILKRMGQPKKATRQADLFERAA